MTARMQSSLTEAAENLLDGFHTHFVHSGWIRHDRQRQRITARVHPIEGGVEARYTEEDKQSGWVSRLLESSRGVSMGRFRLPGLAEIEYLDRKGQLTLLASAWLTPAGDGGLQVFIRVATPVGRMPATLKHFLQRRVFSVILRQDRRILECVSANRARFAHRAASPMDAPQDLLGPSIRKLAEVEEPGLIEVREVEVWL